MLISMAKIILALVFIGCVIAGIDCLIEIVEAIVHEINMRRRKKK